MVKPREVSQQTIEFIAVQEDAQHRRGDDFHAYQDGGGVWTIGYGHTKGVRKGDIWVQATADFWLGREAQEFQDAVLNACTKEPTENQLTAMVSLCYNIGIAGFRKSTVLRYHNSDMRKAFGMWRMDNGKIVQGLVNRRASEAELYLTK